MNDTMQGNPHARLYVNRSTVTGSVLNETTRKHDYTYEEIKEPNWEICSHLPHPSTELLREYYCHSLERDKSMMRQKDELMEEVPKQHHQQQQQQTQKQQRTEGQTKEKVDEVEIVAKRQTKSSDMPSLKPGRCEVLLSVAMEHCIEHLQKDTQRGLRSVPVYLNCSRCGEAGCNNIPFLECRESPYYKKMSEESSWFDWLLITSFVSMKIHKHHRDDVLFDVCQGIEEKNPAIKKLPEQVTKVITVMHHSKKRHYALLEIDLPKKYVVVWDGWIVKGKTVDFNKHIQFVLQKWGIVTDFSTGVVWDKKTIHQSLPNRAIPATTETPYEIITCAEVPQNNTTECGPIACCHAWKVIDPAHAPTDVATFRQDVIAELQSMWKEFDVDLLVRLKKKLVPEEATIIRENLNGRIITYMEVKNVAPEKALKRSAETTVASSKRQKMPNDVHCNVPAQQERQAANANRSLGVVEKEDNSPNDVHCNVPALQTANANPLLGVVETEDNLPNDVHCNIPAQQELQAANANPILGVVETEDNSKQLGVNKAYQLVKKVTGGIGGGASHGPIYGELTIGSMQKMVNLMKEHTDLDSSSFFIDVGSGIGKPNFHVAHDPGVHVSFGLEVHADRWLLSMNCLLATLQFAAEEEDGNIILSKESKEKHTSTREQLLKQKCIFFQGDIKNAEVFDPFTHVYMFSIGFPPSLWNKLAGIWNKSTSPYLICFNAPRVIAEEYGFDVELLAKTETTMHGSNEGHMGYVYRRKNLAKQSAKETSTAIDPVFAEGIEILKGGFGRILEWAKQLTDEKMSSGPHTRTRQRQGTGQSESTAGRGQHQQPIAGRRQHQIPGRGQHQIPPSDSNFNHTRSPPQMSETGGRWQERTPAVFNSSSEKARRVEDVTAKMDDFHDDRAPRRRRSGQNHYAGGSKKRFKPTNDIVGKYNDSSPEGFRDDRCSYYNKQLYSCGGNSSGGDFGDGRYPSSHNNGGGGSSRGRRNGGGGGDRPHSNWNNTRLQSVPNNSSPGSGDRPQSVWNSSPINSSPGSGDRPQSVSNNSPNNSSPGSGDRPQSVWNNSSPGSGGGSDRYGRNMAPGHGHLNNSPGGSHRGGGRNMPQREQESHRGRGQGDSPKHQAPRSNPSDAHSGRPKSSAVKTIHDTKAAATSLLAGSEENVEKEGNLGALEHPTPGSSVPVSEDYWNRLSLEKKMDLLLPAEDLIWSRLVAAFPSAWQQGVDEAVVRTLNKTKKDWDDEQKSKSTGSDDIQIEYDSDCTPDSIPNMSGTACTNLPLSYVTFIEKLPQCTAMHFGFHVPLDNEQSRKGLCYCPCSKKMKSWRSQFGLEDDIPQCNANGRFRVSALLDHLQNPHRRNGVDFHKITYDYLQNVYGLKSRLAHESFKSRK